MAKKIDLKKSIRGRTFFTSKLFSFGSKSKVGDQSVFDSRGAITISDHTVKNRNGEVINVRSIKDAGTGSSLVIERPSSSDRQNPSVTMDQYAGWSYAASKAIADEIGVIEWRLFKTDMNGDRNEIDSNAVLDVLESVNEFQTSIEFKRSISMHLDITGNAYILLGDVVNENSKPTGLYLLNPACVRVVLDKTTYPYKISAYHFTMDGKIFKYQPHQIIHIKEPDPANSYVGMGTMQGISQWISNDEASVAFMKKFFDNGAQIGITFETDMTSEEQLHELRDSFNEQHKGVWNAFKAIFLPKGVVMKKSEVKLADLGTATIADNNRDKILAGFRVPKTILGAAESDTNRATADTADYVFAKRTVKPRMTLICAYLNEFLVPRYGDDLILSFTDPVPEDKEALSNEMKNNVGTLPVMTVNEAREKYLGADPIEGGEKLLAPNTFAPAVDAAAPTYMLSMKPGEKKSNKPKVGYMPAKRTGKTQAAKNAEIRNDLVKSLSEKITGIVLSIKKKSVADMSDQEFDDVILKEKRDRNAGYAKEMRDELVKLNNDQMKEVMDNLPDALKSVKAIDAAKLFNLDKWINLTISALTPVAQKLFQKEADVALELINEPGLDIENTPSAQRAIDRAMSLMAQSYNEDTVSILKEKLSEGLELGYGVEKMGELVSDIYQWKNEIAAERVALTESNRISNDAGKIAWKESGVVTEIKWVTSQRDVCEYCQEMEGETISIDKNFFDKGDDIEGADGGVMTADYSDIGGPPLHPNCHCGIRPVVSKTIEASATVVEDAEVDEAIKELKSL